jgi:dsRNA-specific ribonuclease
MSQITNTKERYERIHNKPLLKFVFTKTLAVKALIAATYLDKTLVKIIQNIDSLMEKIPLKFDVSEQFKNFELKTDFDEKLKKDMKEIVDRFTKKDPHFFDRGALFKV